jgi:DNA-binding FadR family transcriptional regulator
VRLATERIRSENLERLSEICRKHRGTSEIGEKSQLDVEFHLEIARGCGNGILFNIEEGLRKRMENMTKTLLMSAESNRAVHREHELILRCLEKRDRDQATRAMENHLNHAKKILLKILANTHAL